MCEPFCSVVSDLKKKKNFPQLLLFLELLE